MGKATAVGSLTAINTPINPAPNSTNSSFSLSAASRTDIYASPVPLAHYTFSAPILYQQIPKASFISAIVTVSADWSLQYDQGGVLFTIPRRSNPLPDCDNATTQSVHPAWVKAGVEFNDGKAYVSVVGKAVGGWCDWSLTPVPENCLDVGVTVKMTRYKNALMVWLVGAEGKETLVRKVPWVFLGEAGATQSEPESNVAHIGVYAARPDPDNGADGCDLDVRFTGFDVESD